MLREATVHTDPESSDSGSFATPQGSETCDDDDTDREMSTASEDLPMQGGDKASNSAEIADRKMTDTSESQPEVHHVEDTASDSLLIERAEVLYKEDKILEAACLLRKVKETSLLASLHADILDMASDVEESVSDLLLPPGDEASGWKKQGGYPGSSPTNIFTKIDEHNRLSTLIECPIDASLLVPLLAVLNETSLYKDWMPGSSMPKIGIRESKCLQQVGRVCQIVQIVVDVPWPLYTRECIMKAYAVDHVDQDNYIAVRLNAVDSGPCIPPIGSWVERVDFEGMILFRACPPDHELLAQQTNKTDDDDSPKVLVTFKIKVKSHLNGIPMTVINYVTNKMIGGLWAMFLRVAAGIKKGRRPHHKEMIEAKSDLYTWVEQRVEVMLSNMKAGSLSEQQFISYLQS